MWAPGGGGWGPAGPGVSCVLPAGRSASSAPRATTTRRTAWRAPRRSRKRPRRHEAALRPGEARWGSAGSLSLLFPFQTANARDVFLLHTCLQPALLLRKDFGCRGDRGGFRWMGRSELPALPCAGAGGAGGGRAVPWVCAGSARTCIPSFEGSDAFRAGFPRLRSLRGVFILGSSGKVAECISLSPGKAAGGARWDGMGGAGPGLPRPAARPAPGRQGDPETSPCLGFPTCKMGKAAPLYLTGVAVRLLWLTLCKAHQDLWVRGVQEATGSPQRVPAPGRLRCASLSPPVAQGSALGRPPGALHSTPSSQAEAHCECPALPLSCMRAWAGAAPTPPAPLAESLQGRKGFFLPNCF